MEEKTLKNILISLFVIVATTLFLYVIFYALPSFGSTGHESKTIYQNLKYIKGNNINCQEGNFKYYWKSGPEGIEEKLPEFVKSVFIRLKALETQREINLQIQNKEHFTVWYPVGLFFTGMSGPEELIKIKLSYAYGNLGNVVLIKKVKPKTNCNVEFLVKVPPDLPDYFVSIELRTKGGHSPEIGGLVFRVTEPEENIIISQAQEPPPPQAPEPPAPIPPEPMHETVQEEDNHDPQNEINFQETNLPEIENIIEDTVESEDIQEKLEKITEKAEEKIEKITEHIEEKENKEHGPKDKEEKDTEKKSHEENQSKKDDIKAVGHALEP